VDVSFWLRGLMEKRDFLIKFAGIRIHYRASSSSFSSNRGISQQGKFKTVTGYRL